MSLSRKEYKTYMEIDAILKREIKKRYALIHKNRYKDHYFYRVDENSDHFGAIALTIYDTRYSEIIYRLRTDLRICYSKSVKYLTQVNKYMEFSFLFSDAEHTIPWVLENINKMTSIPDWSSEEDKRNKKIGDPIGYMWTQKAVEVANKGRIKEE